MNNRQGQGCLFVNVVENVLHEVGERVNAHRRKGCHVWRQFSAIRFDFDADVARYNDASC
jgi:hypothetical protein